MPSSFAQVKPSSLQMISWSQGRKSQASGLSPRLLLNIAFLVDRRDRHRRRRWWDIETMMTRDTDQVLSAHPFQVVLGNNWPIFPSIAPTQNHRKILSHHFQCLLS